MSPRLRPKGSARQAVAQGRLVGFSPLGESKISAAVAIDPHSAASAELIALVATWEKGALRSARQAKRLGALHMRAAARRLRLRPTLSARPCGSSVRAKRSTPRSPRLAARSWRVSRRRL